MSGCVLGVDGEALEHDEVHVEPFVDALGAVGEFLELGGGVVEEAGEGFSCCWCTFQLGFSLSFLCAGNQSNGGGVFGVGAGVGV